MPRPTAAVIGLCLALVISLPAAAAQTPEARGVDLVVRVLLPTGEPVAAHAVGVFQGVPGAGSFSQGHALAVGVTDARGEVRLDDLDEVITDLTARTAEGSNLTPLFLGLDVVGEVVAMRLERAALEVGAVTFATPPLGFIDVHLLRSSRDGRAVTQTAEVRLRQPPGDRRASEGSRAASFTGTLEGPLRRCVSLGREFEVRVQDNQVVGLLQATLSGPRACGAVVSVPPLTPSAHSWLSIATDLSTDDLAPSDRFRIGRSTLESFEQLLARAVLPASDLGPHGELRVLLPDEAFEGGGTMLRLTLQRAPAGFAGPAVAADFSSGDKRNGVVAVRLVDSLHAASAALQQTAAESATLGAGASRDPEHGDDVRITAEVTCDPRVSQDVFEVTLRYGPDADGAYQRARRLRHTGQGRWVTDLAPVGRAALSVSIKVPQVSSDGETSARVLPLVERPIDLTPDSSSAHHFDLRGRLMPLAPRVTDRVTGAPIEGARFSFESDWRPGAARFVALNCPVGQTAWAPVGRLTLVVTAPGYLGEVGAAHQRHFGLERAPELILALLDEHGEPPPEDWQFQLTLRPSRPTEPAGSGRLLLARASEGVRSSMWHEWDRRVFQLPYRGAWELQCTARRRERPNHHFNVFLDPMTASVHVAGELGSEPIRRFVRMARGEAARFAAAEDAAPVPAASTARSGSPR